jgi:two-component system, NtrC family, response regulator HydG
MSAKSIRIMIVDDDQDLAESLGDLLRLNGYEVELAKDGKDALVQAQAQHFDVTFMDVRMPVMNGVESCLAIKQVKPDARIVMMTGFKEPILEKALGAGAEGPLPKPFNVKNMLDIVKTAG